MLEVIAVSQPVKPWEENFELTVFVKQGNGCHKSNYAAVLNELNTRLKYSQHGEASNITSFEISKVLRDENDDIIESTLIVQNSEV